MKKHILTVSVAAALAATLALPAIAQNVAIVNGKPVPKARLEALEAQVKAYIEQDLPISPEDEDNIRIGDDIIPCTGIRTHVTSTGKIEAFRLLPEFRFNPIDKQHLLVGIVGEEQEETGFDRILQIVG